MRAVVQRVSRAQVVVGDELVGEIGPGLAVLVGIAPSDTGDDVAALAAKLIGLRVFSDDDGRMNLSVADVRGSLLVVSQFTLLGDVRKGRRPSFTGAATPEHAEPLVTALMEALCAAGVPVAGGRFGAHMHVELVNDGPVTLVIEARDGSIA
jgi:D-tyrosyl-tRNA(Tyr) deacylase